MKINQLSDAYAASSVVAVTKTDGKTAGTTGSGRAASTATAATTATRDPGVSVHLSGSLETLSIAAGINDVYNPNKVQQVRADIASGTYRVNAEAIAGKMLDEVRYTLGAHKAA